MDAEGMKSGGSVAMRLTAEQLAAGRLKPGYDSTAEHVASYEAPQLIVYGDVRELTQGFPFGTGDQGAEGLVS